MSKWAGEPALAGPAATPNKQIAAALGISERTVKFHVSSVFTKLEAGNRTEAVTRAVQAGLISL